MWKFILISLGFFLILLFCTEECKRAVLWAKDMVDANPRIKFIAYPFLVLVAVAAAVIITHSLIRFIATMAFSYE